MHSMHVHAMIMMWHMVRRMLMQTTHGHSWGIAQLRLRHVHVPRAARRQRTKGAGAGHRDARRRSRRCTGRRWVPPLAAAERLRPII